MAYKRKGCGPRGLGASPIKKVYSPQNSGIDETGKNIYGGRELDGTNVGSGNTYFTGEDNIADNKVELSPSSGVGSYNRLWTFDQVNKKTGKTKPSPGSYAVPTANQQDNSRYYNAQNRINNVRPPSVNSTNVSVKASKPKTGTGITAEKPKPAAKKPKSKGSIAYGGTKTWAEGSKAAKASTGKSLNQLVAARKGLKKGSAEYNTIQNQINTSLGSKVRHSTPAKKKGYSKKRR